MKLIHNFWKLRLFDVMFKLKEGKKLYQQKELFYNIPHAESHYY